MSEQEPEIDQPPSLLRAYARQLENGGVIAFPTETFYGLLARIDRPLAIERIFTLKGRDFRQPLPVIAADIEQARSLWKQIPPAAEQLMAAYWPGPLTLVLPAADSVSEQVTGKSGNVGVRVPGSAAARGIAAMAGFALAATSANPSRLPPAISTEMVRNYFGETLTVADGPQLPPSKGSTVLDMTCWPPRLLREGDIAREKLEQQLGITLEVRD